MKLAAVIAVLVGGCGGHGSHAGDAADPCTPFSVTASGDASEAQPVWAGDSWAIARPGTYVRIDEAGAVSSAPLPDLPDEPFAFDGTELGYYVATPSAHIALFAPGDVSTLHASLSFYVTPNPPMTSATADVAADATGRIEAYYNENQTFGEAFGWSDGSMGRGDQTAVALALDPAGRTTASLRRCHSISCNQTPPWTEIDGVQLATVDTSRPHLVTSPVASIYRNASGAWKVSGGVAVPVVAGPLAWNGQAFVSFAQGALQLYDADFQPSAMRALTVSGTTLLGVGATPDRALLVLESATPASVDYVQVCL